MFRLKMHIVLCKAVSQSRSKISSILTLTLSHFFSSTPAPTLTSGIYFRSTLTPDSGKILFSTPTLTPTSGKSLRLPRLQLCDTAANLIKPIQKCVKM